MPNDRRELLPAADLESWAACQKKFRHWHMDDFGLALMRQALWAMLCA